MVMRASTRPRAEPSEPNRARKGNGNRRRGNANPSLAIRGDREIYCSWLSVRPAPARRRRCDWGFWLEQAHADQPAVLVDALYDVSVQLELGYDGGRERDPDVVQLGERERLVAGLAHVVESAAVCLASVGRLAGRSQQGEDPRVAIDLELVDDLDLVEANEPRQSPQTLRREAPVDEVIARVHVARLVNLDRGRVGGQTESRRSRARSRRPAANTSASARSNPIGSVTRCKIPKHNATSKRSSSSCRSTASMRRYSTRDPTSPAIARNPAPPWSVMPKRARTQSTYCSLSTATTRRAPRASARKL